MALPDTPLGLQGKCVSVGMLLVQHIETVVSVGISQTTQEGAHYL